MRGRINVDNGLKPASTVPSRDRSPQEEVVHRHSSWEHQQLGDTDPKSLAQLGTWTDLIEQTKLKGTFGKH